MAKIQGKKERRGANKKARSKTVSSAAKKSNKTSSPHAVDSSAALGDASHDVLHSQARTAIYSAFTKRLRTMN